jgi:putative tricarboxylic transport membrane protein
MTDLFTNLALGFGVAFTPINLMLCLIGALVGTLVGVLPGIGTIATVAMLLPITFGLPPVGALIMLAGIYYGAQYGGSTTSILVNIPGEAGSVVTALDGFQMAKQGRAGPALAIAAIGSFFAGCVATVLIAVLGAPLTKLALAFGPAEYFSLMVLGLIFAVVLAKGSVLKAIAMIVFGLLLSMVGSDIETGASRMAFNIPELADGLGFATVAMGLFGFAEIIRNLDAGGEEDRQLVQQKVTGLMPTAKDLKDSTPAILRGTVLGSILGILPGGGAVIASFAAYTLEKKISKDPKRFGRERQQRRGADLLHPAADARHPAERGDGADGRRDDHSRHRPGPAGDAEAAGSGLGHDRLDVDRQSDAAGHQPAAGRHLGPAAARAVSPDVPLHRDLLLDRHLLGEQRTG